MWSKCVQTDKLTIVIADVVKVNDLRRKIQTKVVNFDDIPEDDGNYDDTKSSPSTTSDIFPIVSKKYKNVSI